MPSKRQTSREAVVAYLTDWHNPVTSSEPLQTSDGTLGFPLVWLSMLGLIWTFAVFAAALAVKTAAERRFLGKPGSMWIRRENLAIVILLLASHSFEVRASTDLVEAPIILATAIRGLLVLISVLLVLPTFLQRVRNRRRHTWVGLGAIVVYGASAAFSALYSAAPIVTAGKVFEIGAAILTIWTIALSVEPRRALRQAIGVVILLESALLATAIVGFVAIPGIFSELQSRPGFLFPATMVSPYSHSNWLSATGAVVATYALGRFLDSPKRTMGWLAVVSMASLGVVLASGRQGLVILTASLLVLLWFRRRSHLVLAIGPVAVALLFLYWDTVMGALSRGQPGQLGTLTGRTGFWGAAIEVWSHHPWTGYGFGAGGRFVALQHVGFDPIHLHNGYLEALVGVGIIGFSLLMFATVKMAIWGLKELASSNRTSAIAILPVPLMIHNLVSIGFGGWLNSMFLIFLLVTALSDAGSLGGPDEDQTLPTDELDRSETSASSGGTPRLSLRD